MTKIQATVVADSSTKFGNRLTTLLVTMPRYILAEFNTHRMLSKNSASSRAIPFQKNLKSVMENPFIPVAWMKDHKGMQGNEYFEGAVLRPETNDATTDIVYLEHLWRSSMYDAIQRASHLNRLGLTKQMANRPLEAYMWHTVLVSATEWENFFALRCPQYHYHGTDELFRSKKDFIKSCPFEDGASDEFYRSINRGQADIHIMLVAEAIWDAMNESTPKLLKDGVKDREWHIPFGDNIRLNFKNTNGASHTEEEWCIEFVKIATARCAQTSYTVIGEDEKEMNYEKLIALHDRLSKSGHWSPFEHCARVMSTWEYENMYLVHANFLEDGTISYTKEYGVSGNYRGFIQYRKFFGNENITK
jgi:thymidylate synthase ThyX